jgi:biopolymer transport protein TolR
MGASFGGSDDDEGIVNINITPFVDIILVVLIIFMVTTSYIVRQSIKVNLPDAATGEHTESTTLALMIDETGQLFVDGEPFEKSELRGSIRTLQQTESEITCLIGADKTTPHGDVIALIDLVKQEGVSKFAINIDPVSRPAEAPPIPVQQ